MSTGSPGPLWPGPQYLPQMGREKLRAVAAGPLKESRTSLYFSPASMISEDSPARRAFSTSKTDSPSFLTR